MKVHPFSQLMLVNRLQLQGASAKVCFITPSASNDAGEAIYRTSGEAILSHFFVTPRKQGIIPRFSRRFANLANIATRQLRKEGVLS